MSALFILYLRCILLTSYFREGIILEDDAQSLIGQGKELKDAKPRKEDIVQDE